MPQGNPPSPSPPPPTLSNLSSGSFDGFAVNHLFTVIHLRCSVDISLAKVESQFQTAAYKQAYLQ